jgi:hypothetical protein
MNYRIAVRELETYKPELRKALQEKYEGSGRPKCFQ